MKYPIPIEVSVEFVEKGEYGGKFEDGVPLVDYKFGSFINPVTVSQYALGLWELSNAENVSEAEKDKLVEKFNIQKEWLKNNYELVNDIPVWKFGFDYKDYSLEAGWVSCLSQGNAISVLLRASISGDQMALELAENAFNLFLVPVSEGGVLTSTPEGTFWLEEYPSEQPSYVLNGFIFALFSIYELWKVTGKQHYFEKWQDGLESIKASTKFYDKDYWCFYDRYKNKTYGRIITKHYLENIYIPQYKALYEFSEDEFFNTMAKKWTKYLNSRASAVRVKLHSVSRRTKRCFKRLINETH